MQSSEMLSSSLHSNAGFQTVNLKTHMFNRYKSAIFSHFHPHNYVSASCLGVHAYILGSWKNPLIPVYRKENGSSKGFDQSHIIYINNNTLIVPLYSKTTFRLPLGNGPWTILVPELSGNSLGGSWHSPKSHLTIEQLK